MNRRNFLKNLGLASLAAPLLVSRGESPACNQTTPSKAKSKEPPHREVAVWDPVECEDRKVIVKADRLHANERISAERLNEVISYNIQALHDRMEKELYG
jgi:hypothetical protein